MGLVGIFRLSMKQFNLKILFFALLQMASSSVSAYDFQVDGIYYSLNTSDMTLYVVKGDEPYKGNVVIPNTVEYNSKTLEVSGIGKQAFYYCNELTDISFPTGLKTIAAEAFYGCEELNAIQLPDGLTTIKERAFSGCDKISALTIPSSVMSIEDFAFNCMGIKEIIIEDSDNELKVGHSPFGKEAGSYFIDTFAETAYIGRNLSFEMGDWEHYPFGCNNSLKSVTIGEKVTSLASFYFYGATVLRTVIVKGRKPFECTDYVFASKTYIDGKLIVPNGTLDEYKQIKCWSNFFNIEEDPTMNINIVYSNNTKQEIYKFDGTRVPHIKKGLNIIRNGNSVRKLNIK